MTFPRFLLHEMVQDDAARRDMDLEVRREPEPSTRRRAAAIELPFEMTDAEIRRHLRTE